MYQFHLPRPWRSSEEGGITILVALMLLVLLTISALAMSKNALREVIISGTTRQGADVRNVADSGLEWSMHWMGDDLTNTRPNATGAALALRNLAQTTARDATLQGFPQALAPTGDMIVSSSPDLTRQYRLFLTTMGELELMGTQKNAQQVLDAYNPATLQLWSVRSDAEIMYPNQTFLHRREAWFTLLPKQQQ